MMAAAEYLIAALLILGGSFVLIGSWGLAKLPSLMTRLHGPTKSTTLGVGACLIASMVYFPVFGGAYSVHELLITLFLLLTAPVSANMIAKSHLHRQGHKIDPNPADDIPERLPRPPGGVDWATFEGVTEDGDAAPDPAGRGRASSRSEK